MPKSVNVKRRNTNPYPGDDSIAVSNITMTEWLEALGGNSRRPIFPAEEGGTDPPDLHTVIARTLRSVAATAGSGEYDKAARLLRELRVTDEYLRRRVCMEGDVVPEVRISRAKTTTHSSAASVLDQWLEVSLADGERSVSEINTAGKALGFSEKQLQRARRRLGAKIRWVGRPARCFWRLPGHATTAATLRGDTRLPPDDRGLFNPRHDEMDIWLRGFLKSGPKSSKEVSRRGVAVGFSARELRDARLRIRALIQQTGYPRRTTWLLRGQEKGAKS